MTVIIMNLLVGLTVQRIDEMTKIGEVIQATKRVEDILDIRKITSKVSKYLTRCFGSDWMLLRVMKAFAEEKPKTVR